MTSGGTSASGRFPGTTSASACFPKSATVRSWICGDGLLDGVLFRFDASFSDLTFLQQDIHKTKKESSPAHGNGRLWNNRKEICTVSPSLTAPTPTLKIKINKTPFLYSDSDFEQLPKYYVRNKVTPWKKLWSLSPFYWNRNLELESSLLMTQYVNTAVKLLEMKK